MAYEAEKKEKVQTEVKVGQLAQDLVSGCFRTACVRILLHHLCKISVSGSCGTTCARSLFQDLCEIDSLDHLYQDPALVLVQDLYIISV